ncbi:AAA family ATPase [Marinicellulosiphila megalodicopiae]|uniref:AAA family ATPase n=1 Tax=Marinicellulosiphila megalodicopiae TaxID=2724896 RepID=UPI003BB1DAE0
MQSKIGFVLGKFMPCHNGHKFLFDTASNLVDKLYILVCTRDCEEINGLLRASWVRQLAPKNSVVIHMHKDIPQEPKDDSDFWNIWKQEINTRIFENITDVFGSEKYVIKLAAILNAEPCIIDIDRNHIDISATQIRNNSKHYWDYIPKPVKSYYQKRVCIVGPQSTGKTTLTHYLANTQNLSFVNEYGRDYDFLYKKGIDWNENDFVKIAKCHLAIQKEVSLCGSHIIIEDTDIIQTIVWAQFLLGFVPIELISIFKSINKADQYLLLTPETKWINDGTRYKETEQQRQKFYNELQYILEFFDLKYTVVDSNDYSQRHSKAVSVLDQFLK